MSEEPPQDPSDEALVLLYQRDPEGPAGRRAVEQLLSRWTGRTFGWAYRFTGEREHALDLAQDCLIRVYRALPRYQARGKFSAWIFTIVHNAGRDFSRRRRLRSPDHEVDLDALPTSQASPEEWIERAEEQRAIGAAMLEALEPQERLALWMRAYEGMGMDDITRALNLTNTSGARGLLQTARRKLRAALESKARGKPQ